MAITLYNFNQPDISFVKYTGQLDVLTTYIKERPATLTGDRVTFDRNHTKKYLDDIVYFIKVGITRQS